MLSLAASNYSNSAPLIWSFWHGTKRNEVDLITDAAPAICAQMLREKVVDVALTPVVEFQRIENTFIVPNVCVGAKEKVQSVILVTKGAELKTAKTVALDTSSRTSVALTQIIFREFFNTQPEFISHEPNIDKMLQKAEAALLIGDPALNVDCQKFQVFDLAEIWREFTGYGFVFAVWLVRKESSNKALEINFAAARDEGTSKINEILSYYAPTVRLSRLDFNRYLTQNITYKLDPDLLNGLNLYFQLAAKHNLIESQKQLQFL